MSGCGYFALLFFTRKEKTSTEKKESDVIVKSAYTDKPYLVFIFLNMLYAMSFFQFFSTMPLYYKTELKLNEGQIGWILALNGVLVAAIEMVLIYKIENRWNKFYFISLGAAMLVVSYVSLLFLPYVWWMYVLIIIISFSEMFAMPFMNAFMNARTNESNRGQYAALYVMSWSAAQIILPIFATQTIANMGYDMLWIFFSVICLSVTLGILWVKKMAEV
ncbi:MAG: MFS transporter [Bacteroidetes bacterium]|nr:MFS transporter [Bacteroidota bacterium]